jgi:hypothetical membrane protein
MTVLNSKKMPLTSVGGFLVIVIFLISVVTSSMLYSGSYSIVGNWISDLGSSNKNPIGHLYFNIGCVLTGVAIIISVVGLVKWKTTNRKHDKLILLSQYCGILMAFALTMVGLFSEDYGIIHRIWAIVFFISLLIFMIIVNFALKKHTNYIRWIWYYSVVSILIDFIFVLTLISGLRIPIFEWLAVFSGLIWMGLIGYNTLKLQKPTI